MSAPITALAVTSYTILRTVIVHPLERRKGRWKAASRFTPTPIVIVAWSCYGFVSARDGLGGQETGVAAARGEDSCRAVLRLGKSLW
jgi:hypothetical protein